MRVNQCVGCHEFPCADVKHELYVIPDIDMKPSKIRVAMISEAPPSNPANYYYARGEPLFGRTTVQAFRDAGADVSSVSDILALGVYLTTAVKCSKKGSGISTTTAKQCSEILEQELALFPNLTAIMLMGDVAIKSLNQIARRAKEGAVIPGGSTYKIRTGRYSWRGRRVYPSYLQAGPAFFIEKSKRRMIAEDIHAVLHSLSASKRPPNNRMQRTRPAQATKPRR
jgi:uracil-DNA glycosylase